VKVLLFAYDFPPVLSAQSLRWYYLCSELARLGVKIDVLAPKLLDIWGFSPTLSQNIRVVRSFPGPFIGLSGWLASRKSCKPDIAQTPPSTDLVLNGHSPSMERLYRLVRRMLDKIIFPDVRTEWFPFAWRQARLLHAAEHYDLIISSHEPGVDLLLGLRAHQAWRIPWIADLADPLIAPYTPRWRSWLDRHLERRVCVNTDSIMVTNTKFGTRIGKDNALPPEKVILVNQGFDQRWSQTYTIDVSDLWPANRFILLYTGSLYQGFRETGGLISALSKLDDIVCVFVGDCGNLTNSLHKLDDSRVRLLGRLPHSTCLMLQRRAHLLLSVGNLQDDQVPGKIFEYLGASRPILHLAMSPSDPIPAFLTQLCRGMGIANDEASIIKTLMKLQQRWRTDALDSSFNLENDPISKYSWAEGARKLYDRMQVLLTSSVKTNQTP
jgi:hypothetical protein